MNNNRLPELPEAKYAIVSLVNGRHTYVFLFDAATRHDVLDYFERFALDTRLNFSWGDMYLLREAVLSCGESLKGFE